MDKQNRMVLYSAEPTTAMTAMTTRRIKHLTPVVIRKGILTMDEKTPHASKIATTLLKILRPITAVMIFITLLTSIFILLDSLLPHFGLMLNFTNYGHSMEPSIRGNALILISTPDRTPFEDLNVGDIILFKEPKGLNTATDSIKVHISKVGSPSSDTLSSTSDITTPDMPPEDEMHEMENIEYLLDRAVLHRIIDIVEINTPSSSSDTAGSEERILTTKGDSNPIPDRYPVNADAYLGRMLWHVDYVGSVLLFLHTHFTVILLLTVAMSLMTLATALLRRSHLSAPPSTFNRF